MKNGRNQKRVLLRLRGEEGKRRKVESINRKMRIINSKRRTV
jgi:hypothetical protein